MKYQQDNITTICLDPTCTPLNVRCGKHLTSIDDVKVLEQKVYKSSNNNSGSKNTIILANSITSQLLSHLFYPQDPSNVKRVFDLGQPIGKDTNVLHIHGQRSVTICTWCNIPFILYVPSLCVNGCDYLCTACFHKYMNKQIN